MPLATDVYITPASKKIEWYQSSAVKAEISGSNGDLYVSGSGDVILDSAGLDVYLKSNGTTYGRFTNNGSYWDINGNTGSSYLRFIPWAGGGTTAYTYWGDGTHNQTIYVRGTDAINTNSTTITNTWFGQYDGAGNLDTYLQAGGNSYINNKVGFGGVTSPDTDIHTAGDITVQGGDIFFGNTDKIKLTRGGTTYFQMLTSGGSAAGLQALGVMVNNAYGSTPQRATITIGETGSKPTAAAGYGFVWVSGSTPNKLYYTDDAGTDFDLTAGGGGGTIGGTVSSGKLAIGTGTDTIGNFVDALTEDDSIYIGDNPSDTTSSALGNVSLGVSALEDITTGDYNVAIGYLAGANLTTASRVTIVGQAAGQSQTTENNNTFLGERAGHNSNGGQDVTFVGALAGYNNDGSDNVMIGQGAGQSSNSQYQSVFIGTEAGFGAASSGFGNVALGYRSFALSTSGYYNTAIGQEAGYNLSSGRNNTLIGFRSGYALTTTSHNIFIGEEAGRYATSAEQNTGMGYHALGEGTLTGNENVAIGQQSMADATSATKNVAIGQKTLEKITVGESNVAIGHHALSDNAMGDENIAIGASALSSLDAASDGDGENTAVGYSSGTDMTTGEKNTLFGHQTGHGIESGDKNVVIGAQAGGSMSATASNNTFLGYKAGDTSTGGDGNVMLGYEAGPSSANTSSNTLYINNAAGTPLIGGDFSAGTVTIDGDIYTNSLGQGLRFAGRDDLLIRGTASYDMEITAPQDMAFGIDSDDNETAHKFLFKTNTKTPSTAGTTLMSILETGKVGIGTDAPNNTLEVAGVIRGTNYIWQKQDGSPGILVGNGGNADIYYDGTDLNINPKRGGSGKLKILGSGNLTEDLLMENNKYIKFYQNGGSTYHTSIGYNTSNELLLKGLVGIRLGSYSNGWNDNVVIKNTGKVGIGTSSPAQYLHVKSGDTDQALKLESTDGNVDATFTDSGGSGIIRFATDTFKFYTDSGYSNNPLNLKGGNVGIGTTTPDKLLDVNGQAIINDLYINDDDGDRIRLYRRAANEMVIAAESASLYLNSAYNGIYFEGDSSAVKMRMTGDGKLGIGQTSPAYDLDVNGDANVQGTLYLGDSDTKLFRNSNDLYIRAHTDVILNDTGGKVGIGTAAPTAKLDVISGTNSYEQARFGWDASNYLGVYVDSAGNTRLEAKTGNLELKTDTSAHDVRVDAKGNFRVDLGDSNGGYYTRIRGTSNTPVLMAKSNGLVGIGIESPSDNLHVLGTTKLDGQVNFPIGDGLDTTVDDSKTAWTLIAAASPEANVTGTTTLPASPVDGDYYIIAVTTMGETDPVGGSTRTGTSKLAASHTINGNSSPRTIDTQTGVGNASYFQLHCIYSNSDWNVTKGAML